MADTRAEIRIVIADDHPIVRHGLRLTIEAEADLEVVAEAVDGRAALERIETLRPDIALLDMDMPAMDGLQVARALRERQLPVKVIFLTIHREEALFHAAMDAGASGYILKDSATDDIVSAVRAVVRGEQFTSLPLTSYRLRRGESKEPGAPKGRGTGDLTPTETRILDLLSEYKTSKEIASELHISVRTVETHRANMCQKLGLFGSHALVRYAMKRRQS